MYIESVILNNYRAYKGNNEVTFKINGKNIFLIAGDNGFGKTTFLTSLVWCLYGKLMVDVDEKFRRDINDVSGYKNYARLNLNNELSAEVNNLQISDEGKKTIAKNGYTEETVHLRELAKYSVTIFLSNVSIPSIPCENIKITRSYDYITDIEQVDIFIDGQVNELAKEVGYDIFINDFILSKDIAKFFFFDAEKIVTLAEIRSIDERRKLSTAYSEVLGIKKYEDIKKNLENLRLKLRRKSSDIAERNKLSTLIKSVNEIEYKINGIESQRKVNDENILSLKANIEDYQERLIREGNAISIEELERQKNLRDALREKDKDIKAKLRDMLDIAPFAISGQLFVGLKHQVDRETEISKGIANVSATQEVLSKLQSLIISKIKDNVSTQKNSNIIEKIISDVFAENINRNTESAVDGKILFDYSESEKNEFQALFDNIRYSFSQTFKQLVKDEKNNSIFLSKTLKKISQAENGNDNKEVSSIRELKADAEREMQALEEVNRRLSEDYGLLKKEQIVKKKQLAELTKRVSTDDDDKKKDEIAERLIGELSTFLFKLKVKKKFSLEKRIKSEMSKLMHKMDFINGVKIELNDDIIDIILIDKDGTTISKDRLSKGEQQLYATSILKALVDESEIEFPVFIDSPLQKFDSRHSKNIITQFYPTVSKQVVIFPLLGKELSEDEYNLLLPNVNSAYVIRNKDNRSSFEMIDPKQMFEKRN